MGRPPEAQAPPPGRGGPGRHHVVLRHHGGAVRAGLAFQPSRPLAGGGGGAEAVLPFGAGSQGGAGHGVPRERHLRPGARPRPGDVPWPASPEWRSGRRPESHPTVGWGRWQFDRNQFDNSRVARPPFTVNNPPSRTDGLPPIWAFDRWAGSKKNRHELPREKRMHVAADVHRLDPATRWEAAQ